VCRGVYRTGFEHWRRAHSNGGAKLCSLPRLGAGIDNTRRACLSTSAYTNLDSQRDMKSQQNIWGSLAAVVVVLFSAAALLKQYREQPAQTTQGSPSSSSTQTTGQSSQPLTWTLKNPSGQQAASAKNITVQGTTYSNVEVRKVYPRSIFIAHSGGTVFLERSKISGEDATALGVEPLTQPGTTNREAANPAGQIASSLTPNPTPTPQPRLAPDGAVFVVKPFHVAIPNGFHGFPAGKQVALVKEEEDGFVVSDGVMEAKASKDSFTRDLDIVDAINSHREAMDRKAAQTRAAYQGRLEETTKKQQAAEEAKTPFNPDKYLAENSTTSSEKPTASSTAKNKITFLDKETHTKSSSYNPDDFELVLDEGGNPIGTPEQEERYRERQRAQDEHLKDLNNDLESCIADLNAWFFRKRTKVDNYKQIAETILAITRSSHGKQTPYTEIASWGLSEGDVMGIREALSALGSIDRLESEVSSLGLKTDLTKLAAEQATSAAQLASHEAAYAREAANRASSHAMDASMNAMEASLNSQQASWDAEQASRNSQNASQAVEDTVGQLRSWR
jgi:hypothetical protein